MFLLILLFIVRRSKKRRSIRRRRRIRRRDKVKKKRRTIEVMERIGTRKTERKRTGIRRRRRTGIGIKTEIEAISPMKKSFQGILKVKIERRPRMRRSFKKNLRVTMEGSLVRKRRKGTKIETVFQERVNLQDSFQVIMERSLSTIAIWLRITRILNLYRTWARKSEMKKGELKLSWLRSLWEQSKKGKRDLSDCYHPREIGRAHV